ncbi:nucleotidyltransferase-like protein [Lentibacillus amyloliquefaciens]|uniref:Nucleotidyltransferase-like domain-containing protein n=1 Tax=Lentibacillus amyloliquefaciens TaxID=1472767 RepID=A0A0U4E7W4_9BACI|nr:nucleotidyltransferase-like protein [Lentibacillus amyloliquefaciens]ALX48945.1 hypothetical protein AOX59_10245 [Lentibacillus amyloliquefaciens]
MENLLRPIYQKRTSHPDTLGMILIEKKKPDSPITDNFDVILLIIVTHARTNWQEEHYEYDGKTAVMHTITEELLLKWIDTNGYRKAIEWIMSGEIIFDRDQYVSRFKEELKTFPHEKRDLRKVIEFGKLLKSYFEVRDLYNTGQYKDAFARMVHSLHYLARLAVIEKGYYPEVTLWKQVKKIDPEVNRLYEELIESKEDLPERVQLMMLAADFAISRRTKGSAKHLLDIMSEKDGSWSFDELKHQPGVKPYEFDLASMLNYLGEKGMVTTEKFETEAANVYQRQYKYNPYEI